ncbi:hypothetical protein ACIBCA_28990 [Kitasatospora sp. NPDC051170]|uniref:hypothetical protein n=1 Tax=Kitasatospora sp. NPDC051170 TaxID=3364056 RepID=UPI003795AAB3
MTLMPITATEPDEPAAPTCFVIGPIGDEHAELDSAERRVFERALLVYDEVVRAACRPHGIDPLRADAIADAGEITDQILAHLDEDDLVIADVSGGNPNVMYELGYRDRAGKPTILIGETGLLPFDIARKRTIRFRRDRSGLVQARDQLHRFLSEGLSKGFGTFAAVSTSRGALVPSLAPGAVPGAAPAVEGAAEAEDDAPGLFDRIAQAEVQMEAAMADLSDMEEATALFAAAAEELTATPPKPNQSPNAALVVVKRFSDAITAPSAAFRSSTEAFARRMGDVNAGIHALLDFVEQQPPEERDPQTPAMLAGLIDTGVQMRHSTHDIVALGSLMRQVSGYSRVLRTPAREMAAAVRAIVTVLTEIESWENRARALQ